jgi:hypothetical protein
MPKYRRGDMGRRYQKKGYVRMDNGRWISDLRVRGNGKYTTREPGRKRCPDNFYVKRYGKSAGWCISDKERANRVPCSFMTRRGRRRSKRCQEKSARERAKYGK